MEERATSQPGALSLKRVRVVTRPDVDRALFLWVKHMEAKRESVTGPMMQEKRNRFDEMFKVPQEERLTGNGWIAPFCKAYQIREHRRHGEAGSVDTAAVNAERARMQEILAKYPLRDRWNIDESALNPWCVLQDISGTTMNSRTR
jgi:hypothetical protein